MTAGRPRKTLEDVNKHIESQLKMTGCKNYDEYIQYLMSEGASLTEVRAALGLWEDTYRRFLKEYPEFKSAIKKGKVYSKAWWIRQGRENLKDKSFSYVGWYMNMKNRFGWKDKVEQDQNIKVEGVVIYKPERNKE